ncbi:MULTISPECIES: hypothetical protein [unclassified Streptomyces]|uniref:hypothetical protein n=1 Tax=unclassified Streptomyces TaxID=2593676 RepID=UPI0030780402
MAALVFLFWPDAQPEPDPPPSLSLVDSDVDREENVAADIVLVEGEPVKPAHESASVVSAVLRNSGDNPVLITKADVRLSAVREAGCPRGGGLADIKAQYDIKVPLDAKAGAVLTRKMKYSLPPHSQERVAFTVGPEHFYEGSRPWIYTFTITIQAADGSKVTVPEVTYLSPLKGASGFLATARYAVAHPNGGHMDPTCVSRQARSVAQLVKAAKRPSPELTEFSEELTRISGQ